jgi:acetylornithine deacetylase/succinyl-diaminopimelate desuccinylase-like protein
MAALVASLHDHNGLVVVPGFDAGADEITEERRRETAAFAFDEAAFLADIGAQPRGDGAYSMRERLTLMSCIDVIGMWGGYTGAGSMTVIPHRASAKLTMRLAPGNSPQQALDAVEAHLRDGLAPGCRFLVHRSEAACVPYTLRADHPLVLAAQTVLRATTSSEPVLIRHAATIPIVSLFKEKLGLDTLMFGFHLPDEDIHAPNEFFRLTSFDEGFNAWPRLLRELSKFAPNALRG